MLWVGVEYVSNALAQYNSDTLAFPPVRMKALPILALAWNAGCVFQRKAVGSIITPPQSQPPSSYLWHPPQPRSPSYSHYGQSCLRRDKLQHGGQRTPGCARGPLLFINQTLQGPRSQQLTQLGQHRFRTTVVHLED